MQGSLADRLVGSWELLSRLDRTVATRLVGALSQENVGQVFRRKMSVEADTLTIALDTTTPAGEPVTRTLLWKRVG